MIIPEKYINSYRQATESRTIEVEPFAQYH